MILTSIRLIDGHAGKAARCIFLQFMPPLVILLSQFRKPVGILDTHQAVYHLTYASQRWLLIQLEFAGSMIVVLAPVLLPLCNAP